MKKLVLEDDHYCFACGMDNLHGLRIEWRIEGTSTTAEFTPDRKYQGLVTVNKILLKSMQKYAK